MRRSAPSSFGGEPKGNAPSERRMPDPAPRSTGRIRDGDASRGGEAMQRLKALLVGVGSLVLVVLFLSPAVAIAQQAPQYPLDDKLANEPAPWTVPGKWGKRGNWGRWGEQDKRGMLNYITPDMIVKAAGLVKQGKVYPLGEELHADVPRVITPARVGIQVIQERDGYDRSAAKSGDFDAKRYQGAASFTFMHNHTGTHLDTFAHIYRENALYNNMPAPKPDGTAHGDAASVLYMAGRGVLLDAAGRLDAAHSKWHQAQPGVGPDCLKFLNDMEIVAIGSDNAAVEWGFPVNPKYTRKAFGFLALPL